MGLMRTGVCITPPAAGESDSSGEAAGSGDVEIVEGNSGDERGEVEVAEKHQTAVTSFFKAHAWAHAWARAWFGVVWFGMLQRSDVCVPVHASEIALTACT